VGRRTARALPLFATLELKIQFKDNKMFRGIFNIYRGIFARPIFLKFNMLIFQLSLRGLGILNYENDKVSGESHFIKNILSQVTIKNAPIFFDVGANTGNYTLSLVEKFPGAQIHAFEPHPGNFSILKKNISGSNINLYNFAVGEIKGELILYDRADHENGSSHASLHESVISEIHKQNILKSSVSVETLDDFCERKGIAEIDFMKVDTEGNELAVLHGAKRLLENNKIKCIHFEFNEMNIVSRAFFRDFRKILQEYNLYRLLPQGLILLNDSPIATELFAYQNIIAISKKKKIKF
jgi:FkbM family methyltransferase